MAPALSPKIVLYVSVNEPKGNEKTLYGGKVAAPAFAKILDRVLKYMKVPPNRKNSIAARQKHLKTVGIPDNKKIIELPNRIATKTRLIKEDIELALDIIPDLKGKTLKETIRILTTLGLKGIYEGNGIVINQDPAPGAPIPDSKILLVSLSPEIE
jgi:hypothetical protein